MKLLIDPDHTLFAADFLSISNQNFRILFDEAPYITGGLRELSLKIEGKQGFKILTPVMEDEMTLLFEKENYVQQTYSLFGKFDHKRTTGDPILTLRKDDPALEKYIGKLNIV